MPDPLFDLVTLPNGARSLRSRQHGETFHPGIGPMEEARTLHVAQHRFQERIRPGKPFVVWDIGLGAGANALAVIEAACGLAVRPCPGIAEGDAGPITLLSFDHTLDPLRFALRHADDL